MLSSHADPLLSIPPTVPWRAPVAPLSASAMVLNCVVIRRLEWKEGYEAGFKHEYALE